jgi:transcriptional regulator with XRE-family HTH domain
MSNKTLAEWVASQPDGGRLFDQERLIVETTEEIWAVMNQQGVHKAELAKNLDRSKAYISQVLSGTRNMTLRTLSDIARALGHAVEIRFADRRVAYDWTSIEPTASQLIRRPPAVPPELAIHGDGWSSVVPLLPAKAD